MPSKVQNLFGWISGRLGWNVTPATTGIMLVSTATLRLQLQQLAREREIVSMDDAGRVITYWEYTLRVEAKVTSGAPSSTGGEGVPQPVPAQPVA